MSRVGKYPVKMPSGVTGTLSGQKFTAKGKNGELSYTASDEVTLKIEADNSVSVTPLSKSKRARSLWGTDRANINNIVRGVSEGFTKTLEIEGVGLKAAVQGKDVVLSLGFSHEIRYPIPAGITIKAEKPTVLVISGNEKQVVGQVAAEIRGFKKPEPYKGKGIRYAGEYILRKEGKKK